MQNDKCKMINVKSRRAGFSLVELLVVITIIAILSVVAYIALGGQTAKARNSRRMQDVSTVQSALEIYFINNNNNYPSALDNLVAGNLMNEIPVDPTTDASYEYYLGAGDKTYNLAATLEDETGGLANEAYVVGNGTLPLAGEGCTYNPATGDCNCGSPCALDDEDTGCLPYCL